MMTKEAFACLAEKYIDMVFRVAFNYLRSKDDAEDVAQNVFLKLLREKKDFDNEDHVKRWLIRVTVNECKSMTRSKWWKQESFEDYAAALYFDAPGHSDLFYAVMDLPKKYRLPIYLYHYEGYSTDEIAGILNIPKGTVCIQLKRGREQLKKSLTEVDNDV